MKFILSTDDGVFCSVRAETLEYVQAFINSSGYLLSMIQHIEFEDKVIENLVQLNVELYKELTLYMNQENAKKEKSTDTPPESKPVERKPKVEKFVDNVIQFPFGKKDD